MVELVYFDIHARGELVRLCYAAHAAQGGRQAFTDTRLPFFMDSEVNQRLCDQVHRPAAPFGFFPYLNVFDEPNGQPQPISGDGVIEGFVARRLGLVGADETEAAVALSVAFAALSPCSPPLTGAGLRGDSAWIVDSVQPGGEIGTPLAQLERFVNARSTAGHIVGGSLTVADLAVFNVLDECLLGPRSNRPQHGVEEELRRHYPRLLGTYALVGDELADYITERQGRFLSTGN